MAKGLNETKVDVASLIRTIAVRGQDVGEDKGGYIDDVNKFGTLVVQGDPSARGKGYVDISSVSGYVSMRRN